MNRTQNQSESRPDPTDDDPSAAEMAKRYEDRMHGLRAFAADAAAAEGDQASRGGISPELARIRDRLDRLSQKISDAAKGYPETAKIDESGENAPESGELADVDNISALASELKVIQEKMSRSRNAPDQPELAPVVRAVEQSYSEIAAMLANFSTQDGSALAEASARLDAMNSRLDEIGTTISDMARSEEGPTGLAGVEKRLDELSVAIQALSNNANGAATQRIEDRIGELAQVLDALIESGSLGDGPYLPEGVDQLPKLLTGIDERLDALGKNFENLTGGSTGEVNEDLLGLLQQLADRVERIAQPSQGELPPQIASLEAQLGEIVSRLDSIPAGATDLTPINERLESIDQQLAVSRDVAIDVATQAAEQAVQMVAANSDVGIAQTIEGQIAKLEADGREEQQRHQRNFDVLQKTLIAIAERLDLIDDSIRNISTEPLADEGGLPPSSESEPLAEQELHSINVSAPLEGEEAVTVETGAEPVPAFDPHAFAPSAPTSDELLVEQGVDVEDDIFAAEDDSQAVAEMIDDAPLEPGSKAPDLSALVRHASERRMAVKEERREREENAADYLAAARRAAKAAAEAAALTELEEEAAASREESSRLDWLKKKAGENRKAVFVAGAALIIAVVAIPLAMQLTDRQVLSSGEAPATIAENSNPSDVKEGGMAVVDNQAGDVVPPELASGMPMKPATGPIGQSLPFNSAALVEPAGPEENPVVDMPNPVTGDDDLRENSTALATLPPEEAGNSALRQAAVNGDPKALFEIARRYTEGEGVERDLAEAAKWYEKAAERGFAPAQYRYGNFLEKGHGVSVDLKKSAAWYEKAARNGNALAMHNLAVLQTSGLLEDGVNLKDAIGWFRKASDLGIKDSQVNLGIIYAKGLGTEKDLTESYKWFAVAAREGDPDAAQKRDTIAAALTPNELEGARANAEIWQPLPLDGQANTPEIPDEWKGDSNQAARRSGLLENAGDIT